MSVAAREALITLVVFAAVWAAYGAIQGEGLDLVRAVFLGMCVAVGALGARTIKNRRADRRASGRG